MWAVAALEHGLAFSKYKSEVTKDISFIYVDDIFDLAGPVDKLSLFTDKRSMKATHVYSNRSCTTI